MHKWSKQVAHLYTKTQNKRPLKILGLSLLKNQGISQVGLNGVDIERKVENLNVLITYVGLDLSKNNNILKWILQGFLWKFNLKSQIKKKLLKNFVTNLEWYAQRDDVISIIWF